MWVFTWKAVLSTGPINLKDHLSTLPHPAVKPCIGTGTRPRADSASAPPPSSMQVPHSSFILTAKSADFPDTLQGSPLQEGHKERILFSETFSKGEEFLNNKAIQHSFHFNRYDKGYCTLFIILICCNFMLLSKTEC